MYAYIEPCACVCGRDMEMLYLLAFLRVPMPLPFTELVTCNTYHQLLSNHLGFKMNTGMKCGAYSTVVIMQAVYSF